MKRTADAVVIGAGALGASIAHALCRQGRDVVVLDKGGGVGHGSTSASSAIVRFNYSSWAGVALSWESLHCWLEWERHLDCVDPAGLARFHRTGLLLIRPGDADDTATRGLFDRAAIPWEHWEADDVARNLPGVDTGAYWPPKPVDSEEFYADANGKISGTFTPDAGYIDDPTLAAHNLAHAASQRGATFWLRREVSGIVVDDAGRWRVSTANGEVLESAVVVNAAGPWSGQVNQLAGVGAEFTVRTRPLRQEVHYVQAPMDPGRPTRALPVLADLDLGIYIRPDAGGGLLVGGTEPACDELEWLGDPDAADPNPTVPRFRAQVMRAARRITSLGVPGRPRGVAGVYDVSDDWTPIYDRTAQPGFYVAIGTSGNQFKNSPIVGTLIATLISEVERGRDHDADPVRLTLPRTGHVVDLGAFSRLRHVTGGAPSSVMG